VHKERVIISVKLTGDFFFYPEEKLFKLEGELGGTQLSEILYKIKAFYEKEGIEFPGLGPDSFFEVIRKAVGDQ
jgi:hypothetical protein